uniref:Uncharacterized protein n=1 Tax=Anguilla anguilla TaxID=7936 RepID=A0A0E9WKM3_ANGAN
MCLTRLGEEEKNHRYRFTRPGQKHYFLKTTLSHPERIHTQGVAILESQQLLLQNSNVLV